MIEKGEIISNIAEMLLNNNKESCLDIISSSYPHNPVNINKRAFSLSEKMTQFIKDGFIDRYTGEKLVNPGILKVISFYFPDKFPYHPHGKMSHSHIAYWELIPSIDHIFPVARGGNNDPDNWITTSMKNNLIKNNYTIEEINWKIHPKGNIEEWDGLTNTLIKIVENNTALQADNYINQWYKISKKLIFWSKP